MKHVVILLLLFAGGIQRLPADEKSLPWTFVSIPDFLNFDIEYPQEGWEDALGFILESMKMENSLPSPASGSVKALPFDTGSTVSKGDVLAVISP